MESRDQMKARIDREDQEFVAAVNACLAGSGGPVAGSSTSSWIARQAVRALTERMEEDES